jgi:hypothetical protein
LNNSEVNKSNYYNIKINVFGKICLAILYKEEMCKECLIQLWRTITNFLSSINQHVKITTVPSPTTYAKKDW